MRQTLLMDREKGRLAVLLGSISVLFIYLGLEWTNPSIPVAFAHVQMPVHQFMAASSCPSPTKPDASSLLVVLLDRSGSLVVQPGATDPEGYSTSITKALADLWPGSMIVIPFSDPHVSNTNLDIPVLPVYKALLSDSTQRDTLKTEVENYPIMGGTPLAPALRIALEQSELQHHASGSRAIIITDGAPTPTSQYSPKYSSETTDRQIEEITTRDVAVGKPSLISQFHDLCIPVSAFGLQTDEHANNLLTQIAQGTNGTYIHVQSPQELAQQVIQQYNDWLGLKLDQSTRDTDGTFPVLINDFANHADIVAFRSDAQYNVALFGKDGKTPVSGVQPRSIDKHYEIYGLDMSLFPAGTYKVNIGNDSAAQVYGLADYSRLQVKLISSDAKTAYINQPLTIKAALFDRQKQYVPRGLAELTVDVTYHVEGQSDTTITKTLEQQGEGIFSYQLLPYNRPGQLRIVIHAKYEGIQKDSQVFTLDLTKPPVVCTKGLMQCTWEQYQSLIWIALSVVGCLILLLIAFLLWSKQPEPFGYLHSKRNENVSLPLKTLRTFPRSLFHKSTISSAEIRDANRVAFPVGAASFSLVFKSVDKAYIRAEAGDIGVELPDQNLSSLTRARSGKAGAIAKQEEERQRDTKVAVGAEKELPYRATIKIGGTPFASFEAVGKVKTKK